MTIKIKTTKKGMIVSCQKGTKRITTFEGEIFWMKKADNEWNYPEETRYGIKNITKFQCYCKQFASAGECKHSKEDTMWINHTQIISIAGLADWRIQRDMENQEVVKSLPKKGAYVWLKNNNQTQGIVFWTGMGKNGPSIGFKRHSKNKRNQKAIFAKIGEFGVADSNLKNVPKIKGKNPYRNPFNGEYCTEKDFYGLIKEFEMFQLKGI